MESLLQGLASDMWGTPTTPPPAPPSPQPLPQGVAPLHPLAFDPDKTLNCSVENGATLVHGTGGRGYGLGATAVTAGCYTWKVRSIECHKHTCSKVCCETWRNMLCLLNLPFSCEMK